MGADRERLDRRLRQALEPSAEEVGRLVRGALREPAPPPVWPRRLAVATVCGLVLAAGLWWALLRQPPTPQAANVEAGSPKVLTITNARGVVTVESPAGGSLVILGGGKS